LKIRPTRFDDMPPLRIVLDETGLFPSDLLPDLLSNFLHEVGNNEIWLTAEIQEKVVGFCYAVQEKLTVGTWNMLAIAMLPSRQGDGIGGELVRELELLLRKRGNRVVIVETSGTGQFAQTRKFYRNCGYTEEARIRDFWAVGDDKVIFWKSLALASI